MPSSPEEKNGGTGHDNLVPLVPPLEVIDFVGFVHTPLYKNKEFLHQKYVVEGLSLAQISEQIVSSKCAVRSGLLRAGISVREPNKPHGRPSQPKFGQKNRLGRVSPHQIETRVIEAIQNLKQQGMGLRQIARTMTQLKIPTKCRGKAWHPEMVRRILSGSTT